MTETIFVRNGPQVAEPTSPRTAAKGVTQVDQVTGRRAHGARGEWEEFAAIYPGLHRFAALCAPYDMDPDDLVQEALTRTLARRSVDHIEDPVSYIRAAIRNLARDHFRARRRQARPEVELSGMDAYPSDLSPLVHLSPLDRAAVFYVDVERMSHRDAADQLGCSTLVLKARLSRGRKSLRKYY